MKNDLTLKIGYDDGNDITIKHDSVSATHAYITMLNQEQFEIKDAGSRNGIHVNNRRIKSKIIDSKDQVIIGGKEINTSKILNQAKQLILNKRQDFTPEYKQIILKLESYNKEKDRIAEGNNTGNILRIGGSVLLILILFFKPDLIPDATVRYILIMGIGLIPVILNFFSEKGEKKRTKLELLKLEYEDEIRCPKCNSSLLRHTPLYLKKRGKCINEKCNARHTISD